ncbi:Holliday junction branch migration protein RuvA [bacterium]|nr:Holliday junction branch migration protein RuvA [bacterium]
MIGRLRGTIVERDASGVVLDVNGVGYTVHCPQSTLDALLVNSEATLTIHTEMKESEIRLYGFSEKLEQQLFQFLLQVNGVGPKSALEVLSSMPAAELIRVLGSGDAAKIQRAKGIGKKTAGRIVLELKDKVASYALTSSHLTEQIEVIRDIRGAGGDRRAETRNDATLALLSLGFSRADAEGAVEKVFKESPHFTDAGDVVKAGLSYL